MDKYIVLCKEKSNIYGIYEGSKDIDKEEREKLRLRSIYNTDIDYYLMKIPQEMMEAVKETLTNDYILAALNKWPDLLQSSPLIERI